MATTGEPFDWPHGFTCDSCGKWVDTIPRQPFADAVAVEFYRAQMEAEKQTRDEDPFEARRAAAFRDGGWCHSCQWCSHHAEERKHWRHCNVPSGDQCPAVRRRHA